MNVFITITVNKLLFTTTIVKSQFQIAFSDFGDTFFKTFLALKITKKTRSKFAKGYFYMTILLVFLSMHFMFLLIFYRGQQFWFWRR